MDTASKNERMSFLKKDSQLIEKYHNIWYKVSNSIRKGLDNEPVSSKKYRKSKIKSYEGKINTNFHNDGTPKEGSHCICLSVILIKSVFKVGKNYCSQVFLE